MRSLQLADLRERVVVLVAFQVLCPKSLSHGIPQAQRIYETFEPGDVTVIGLHATFEHHDAISPAVLKAFMHEYRLKFPIALDQPSTGSSIAHTMERYKMRGTPSAALINNRRRVPAETSAVDGDARAWLRRSWYFLTAASTLAIADGRLPRPGAAFA